MDFNEKVICRGAGVAERTNMGCRGQRPAALGNHGPPEPGRLPTHLSRRRGFLRWGTFSSKLGLLRKSGPGGHAV